MELLEEVQARHRKEVKDLAGQITALKKSVTKGAGDKKKKKDVQDQMAAMEAELKERHQKEIAMAKSNTLNIKPEGDGGGVKDVAEVVESINNIEISNELASASTEKESNSKKKPNRQQQRKARKAAEFEEMRKQVAEEVANAPNMREVEMNAIESASRPLGLSIRSLAHSIRKIAADYLRNHCDSFLPFVAGDMDKDLTDEDYEKYCDDVENSATWGGQIELQALSQALKRQIHVFQMNTPVIKIGEDFPGEPLTIS
ncbi:OTU domain-containing protein 6A [Dinochytrium kinnereticum]|nr:OTU domain-containing protein 6A [Dinochytrium kinnereticum]